MKDAPEATCPLLVALATMLGRSRGAWSHLGVQKGAPSESKSSAKREKVPSGTHAFFEHFPETISDDFSHDFASPKTSKIVLPCRRQHDFQEIAVFDVNGKYHSTNNDF